MIGETYSGVEAPSQFESWLAGAQTERIVDLIRDFSIETVPISAPKITSMGVHLEHGSDVYVGWPPSRSIGAVIETAARLSRWGYRPVPHIAARSIATRDDLAQALRRLSAEAGVDQVLLVGGSRFKPLGEFHCALQILETGLFEEFGIRRLGLAGHPEGHPEVGRGDLVEALRQKLAYGRRAGVDMYIATQFGFDANAVVTWVEEVRRAFGPVPVHVGVPGPASLTSLVKYARICGIGDSVRFLTRGANSVLKLATTWTPDKFLTALAHYQVAKPRSGIEKVHFYSFGGAARTARWLAGVRDGNFTVHADGRGFTVSDRVTAIGSNR
jgi:methylenetetrahydrofolate reductase (NADPH)